MEKKSNGIASQGAGSEDSGEKLNRVKFEVFGHEVVEKEVRLSGNSGRVYLPPNWVGCKVKIIRID